MRECRDGVLTPSLCAAGSHPGLKAEVSLASMMADLKHTFNQPQFKQVFSKNLLFWKGLRSFYNMDLGRGTESVDNLIHSKGLASDKRFAVTDFFEISRNLVGGRLMPGLIQKLYFKTLLPQLSKFEIFAKLECDHTSWSDLANHTSEALFGYLKQGQIWKFYVAMDVIPNNNYYNSLIKTVLGSCLRDLKGSLNGLSEEDRRGRSDFFMQVLNLFLNRFHYGKSTI